MLYNALVMRAPGVDILVEIAETLEKRKGASGKESYVASLYDGGNSAINEKIMEEAREVVGVGRERAADLIHEIADLWFHCQVLLAYRGINISEIFSELRGRFGVSGHEEKRRRILKEEHK